MLQDVQIFEKDTSPIAVQLAEPQEVTKDMPSAIIGSDTQPIAVLTDDPVTEEIIKHSVGSLGGDTVVFRDLIPGIHKIIRDPSNFSHVIIKLNDETRYDQEYVRAIKLLRSRSLRMYREKDACLPIAIMSGQIEEAPKNQSATIYCDASFGNVTGDRDLVKLFSVSWFSCRNWLMEFRRANPGFS